MVTAHELAVAVSVNVMNLWYYNDPLGFSDQADIILATLEEIADMTK